MQRASGRVPDRRRARRSRVLAMCAAALTFAACSEPPPPAPPPVRPVKMLTISGDGGGTLEFPGTLRAVQHADMAFEVPGRIQEFLVREGTPVRTGQVLARLDPRDYQAELDKARTNTNKARADFERYDTLYRRGISPKMELERYQRIYENSQANLRIAEKKVEDTVLRAPFDGVLAAKRVEDFANVRAKQAVLVLQDASALRIDAAVPERDFARMQPGLTLAERTARLRPRVVVSGLPGREFPARITEFTTDADPATRTYRATLEFAPGDGLTVLPGMTARVILSVGEVAGGGTGALRVPVTAIVADGPEPFVWIVDPDSLRVAKAAVQLGEVSGDTVEVRAGLRSGQTIATSGAQLLRDGMTVRRFER